MRETRLFGPSCTSDRGNTLSDFGTFGMMQHLFIFYALGSFPPMIMQPTAALLSVPSTISLLLVGCAATCVMVLLARCLTLIIVHK